MEKILLVVNSSRLNTNTVDFACQIANLTNSALTGILLAESEEVLVPVNNKVHVGKNLPFHKAASTIKYGVQDYEASIGIFREACRQRGIKCDLNTGDGDPFKKIIAETRFADLLVVDQQLFTDNHKETGPSALEDILSKSECPVVIAPNSFGEINEIVFAYDGEASSVFALKQFTCLFPMLGNKKVTILQVSENDHKSITNLDKVLALVQIHYAGAGFVLLHGKLNDTLFNYLAARKNVFVVMGASHRNMLSGIFKKSAAGLPIEAVDLPVFIGRH